MSGSHFHRPDLYRIRQSSPVVHHPRGFLPKSLKLPSEEPEDELTNSLATRRRFFREIRPTITACPSRPELTIFSPVPSSSKSLKALIISSVGSLSAYLLVTNSSQYTQGDSSYTPTDLQVIIITDRTRLLTIIVSHQLQLQQSFHNQMIIRRTVTHHFSLFHIKAKCTHAHLQFVVIDRSTATGIEKIERFLRHRVAERLRRGPRAP